MGPLVPFGVIGVEFNYIVALFIGFFFGYILERAGFSTSRKLVGVFYGYDFVVLRVFFTAAATAASGLLIMDYAGAIDISFLYINPLYLNSAVTGGVIMGLGFILGGFCPGTSVVAASVGKIDAMIFIFGSFIGIFIFGETYHLFEEFHNSTFYGSVFVYDSLGMSRGLFAFALILIAVTAFIVTDRIEKNVSYGIQPNHPKYKRAYSATVTAAALAVIMLLIPGEEKQIAQEAVIDEDVKKQMEYVTVDEAAYDIYHKDGKFRFIDLRSKSEYKEYCLPGAVNMSFEEISKRTYSSYFEDPVRLPVFYGDDQKTAEKACAVAFEEGYEACFVLKGGLEKFKQIIYNTPAPQEAGFIGSNTYDFRLKVRSYLQSDSTLTKPKEKKKIEKKIIKVQGGC